MKLYTSYWAQVRNFPRNLVGLNTTVWPPRWRPLGKDKNNVLVVDCPPMKPGSQCAGLCDGKCNPKQPDTCKFLKTYREQLDYLDFDNFYSQLETLKQRVEDGENLTDVNFAFIVFEKYDNPCSERWPIQEWFKKHNMEIQEWQLDNNQ